MHSIRACVVQAASALVSMASTATQTAISKVSSLWRKPNLDVLEIRRQGEWVHCFCNKLRKGNRVRCSNTNGKFLCMLRFDYKCKDGAYSFTIMTDDGRHEYPWEQINEDDRLAKASG